MTTFRQKTLAILVIAITCLLPALALAGQKKPPFTLQGSATMIGRWGHNAVIIINGGNGAAGQHYTEYDFRAKGVYIFTGFRFGEAFGEKGFYRLDGKILQMFARYYDVKGKWVEYAKPTYAKTGLMQLDGFPTFHWGLERFQKGLWWDYASGCYRDTQGNRYAATGSAQTVPASNVRRPVPKDPIYGLFPYEPSNDRYDIKATFNGRKLAKLTVTLWHQMSFGEKHFAEERSLIIKAANKWLVNHGFNLKKVKITYLDK